MESSVPTGGLGDRSCDCHCNERDRYRVFRYFSKLSVFTGQPFDFGFAVITEGQQRTSWFLGEKSLSSGTFFYNAELISRGMVHGGLIELGSLRTTEGLSTAHVVGQEGVLSAGQRVRCQVHKRSGRWQSIYPTAVPRREWLHFEKEGSSSGSWPTRALTLATCICYLMPHKLLY